MNAFKERCKPKAAIVSIIKKQDEASVEVYRGIRSNIANVLLTEEEMTKRHHGDDIDNIIVTIDKKS